MNNNIKLVVFDIAGTTVKDHGEIAIAFKTAMKEHGYDVHVEKINPLMGYKKPEAIKMMLNKYEAGTAIVTDDYINHIHERFIELMVEYYKTTDQLQALPHAEDVFEYLKQRGAKIGLNTGFSNHITDIIIERLGWLKNGIIDYLVSSNQVAAGRPQPFMIQKMMQAAGISDAKQVVKLGDTEVDINEGKNAGCLYSIAVTTGAFTRESLMPYNPDFIIDGLNELVEILEK